MISKGKIAVVTQSNNYSEVKSTRIHYMDNLRAYAMLLGIFFHAALAYSPLLRELWLASDNQQSVIIDIFAWFTHLFRMPIFFLISGFFSCFLIEKRGVRDLLKNRASRILIPLIIFLPLVLIAAIFVIIFGMNEVENKSFMLQFIIDNKNSPDTPSPASLLNTMHLWFLYYLMLFNIVAIIFYKWGPIKLEDLKIFKSAKAFLIIFPLLLIPGLMVKSIPHPAPDRIYPELWSFGFYGIFFLLGWFLFKNMEFLDKLKVYWKQMIVVGIICYIFFYILLPETFNLSEEIKKAGKLKFTLTHVFGVILEAYVAVHITLVILLAGKEYLNKKNNFSRLIADSSYWIYLIHLPLLLYIQFILLDIELNLWIKFIIANFSVIGIGLITYVLFIRWTPIGALLNGKRKSIKSIFYG